MRSHEASPLSVSRLFAVYALVSLLPVFALGFVLAGTYRHEANARGLSESRAESALLARTGVAPLLTTPDLANGLTPAETTALNRLSDRAIAAGEVLRLRVRTLTGNIVFASDDSAVDTAPDPEALEAASGHVESEVTRLDADESTDGDAAGIRTAEVYRPLMGGSPLQRIGVLEVYLPYDPIAADVTSGLRGLYRDLGLGLGFLWLALVAISFSVTRRLRGEVKRNSHLAEHDVLTGLPNRALFHRRVVDAIAQSPPGGVAVALVDLDRFKEVNDTLGHVNGDRLLCELAKRLASAMRSGDTVARLGGDEFGVVLTDICGAEGARDALITLRRLLQLDVEVDGLPLAVDASIGFALVGPDGRTVDALLQHADVAMYVAKNTHAGVTRYDSGQDHYDSGKLALVAELRRAIENEELVVHYQPKTSVATGAVVAVEALVRWNHPDRGLLYPDSFLPIAEQTGLIDSLTRWVLRTATQQYDRWGHDVVADIAINISARNLAREDFADTVLETLARTGMPAQRLLLEITETALVDDPERAGRSLRRLTAAGIRISLDDFGCGQTSLGYLSTLPLHEVKIDKSFVTDMLDNRSHAAIVRSVIDLAHNLGFEVVAEGVETHQVLSALDLLGCDIAQGYLFARPMPGASLPGWIADRAASVCFITSG